MKTLVTEEWVLIPDTGKQIHLVKTGLLILQYSHRHHQTKSCYREGPKRRNYQGL